MHEQKPTDNIFERFPTLTDETRRARSQQIARLTLQCANITGDFTKIERIPRINSTRENDVEHSYMLALAAPEIAHEFDLDADIDKIRRFALVHDMLELKVGDVATFDLTAEQLAEKEHYEQLAMEELLQELPEITRQDLCEHEQQNTKEAVFVRMVDKLLPVAVDSMGDGARVIQEDYGVNNLTELIVSHDRLHARISEKFGVEFPDLVAAHAQLCLKFEEQYDKLKTEKQAILEAPREPIETEHKYYIERNNIPQDLDLESLQRSHLRQGYIAVGNDGSETRVRSFDDERFEMTVKSPGMLQRGEQTITISREMFESLWHQTDDRQIEKTRYYIPYEGHNIDLDVYGGYLEGLITAEVEFRGRSTEARVRANTFTPPEWFGENITEDLRFKNHQLATLPHHMPLEMGAKSY